MSFIITIKLIFTFLSSLILIKLIMHNTTFLGLTDIQNERSLHQEVWYWYWDKFLPFTIFALAGFTNALNLIDGLDASISIVILSSFLYIGYIHKNELMIVLCSLTIASLLAFLIFNWNPAKIFMGDSGSLFLGFIISVVACISLEYIHPIAIFYLAALPIVDTLGSND